MRGAHNLRSLSIGNAYSARIKLNSQIAERAPQMPMPSPRGSLIAAAVMFIASMAPTLQAQMLTGRASAIDGRTLVLSAASVRLHGIDAPDNGQTCFGPDGEWPCGMDAWSALTKLVATANAECAIVTKAGSGNAATAICAAGGVNLASEMVSLGYALNWPAVGRGSYVAEQESAKAAQRGIWRGSFDLPSEWRRRKK